MSEKMYAVALKGGWQGVFNRHTRDEHGKIIPKLSMTWNAGQTRLINKQQLDACKKDIENGVLIVKEDKPKPKEPDHQTHEQKMDEAHKRRADEKKKKLAKKKLAKKKSAKKKAGKKKSTK